MQGKIVKGISGFYYVHVGEPGIYECKAKGAFRNQKIKPLVGDDVEIAIVDEETKKGNIEKILPRKNELIRPAVANIDLALIIFAAAKPQPNFNLLDRFLIMMEYQDVPVTICFNKKDLLEEQAIEEFAGVYRKCGYSVLYTSAEKEEGIRELHELLDGRTTAVAGPSGVGKSSLVNRLQPNVQMETGSISRKIERGKHTSEDLILMTRLSYPISSISFTLSKALSTSPSAVTPWYFSTRSFSKEPLFTPTRIGMLRSFATSTTAFTRSALPIFPGLIRILSAPFSIAAIARR